MLAGCAGIRLPRPPAFPAPGPAAAAGLRVAVSCSLRTAPASLSCPLAWLGWSRGALSESAGGCDPHHRFADPMCPQALPAPVPTTVLWKHFSGTASCNRSAVNIGFSRESPLVFSFPGGVLAHFSGGFFA